MPEAHFLDIELIRVYFSALCIVGKRVVAPRSGEAGLLVMGDLSGAL